MDSVEAVVMAVSAWSCRSLKVFQRSRMAFLLGIGPSVQGIPNVVGGLLESVLKRSCLRVVVYWWMLVKGLGGMSLCGVWAGLMLV